MRRVELPSFVPACFNAILGARLLLLRPAVPVDQRPAFISPRRFHETCYSDASTLSIRLSFRRPYRTKTLAGYFGSSGARIRRSGELVRPSVKKAEAVPHHESSPLSLLKKCRFNSANTALRSENDQTFSKPKRSFHAEFFKRLKNPALNTRF
jgi:hypothetical protein